LAAFEILILSALILATRCANYHDVFVDRNIYFLDADCYARMTRVRICAEHPGTVIRHHDFENFPSGTTPHTTAPLDYLILTLSILLKSFTAQPLDLAGAIVSPLLALIAGWFLWWWSRRMKIRYRWAMLIFFAISPILAHGTALGRPDHQSLLMLLVTIGICAEWSLQTEPSRSWSIVSAVVWAVASWVSLYEPLILLVLVIVVAFVQDRQLLFNPQRRIGWIVFGAIILVALLIERRIPSLSIFQSNGIFRNWSRSVGELAHVSPANPIWFAWSGYLIAVAPILIWWAFRKRSSLPVVIAVLLTVTFLLTTWQARWSYFFLSVFVISLPSLLAPFESRVAVWIALTLSSLPILRFWDAEIWPNDSQFAARIERRNESRLLRELAVTIRSDQIRAFLAPWWLSPSISYWSGQPGVAGSSHQSLAGIADSARVFLATDAQQAREILRDRHVEWVFAYDWDRVRQNSVQLLGPAPSRGQIGQILDRTPGQAPVFLTLSGQNGAAKLFRFWR
jgi:hypothetical protein